MIFEQLRETLPPKTVFPAEMPRYPNLWFCLDAAFLLRPEYHYAVAFLTDLLEQYLGLSDTLPKPKAKNEHLTEIFCKPREGADFEARIGPLQYYYNEKKPEKSHIHQLHARFYASPLWNVGCAAFKISDTPQNEMMFLIPASVHYEVATEDPLHPYVDACPLCGITGTYNIPIRADRKDYCLKIHDPLGLEFLLYGTIRGNDVYGEDMGKIRCVSHLKNHFDCSIETVKTEKVEPLELGMVVIRPFKKKESNYTGR